MISKTERAMTLQGHPRSSKITEFLCRMKGLSLCDLLLVINSNLNAISHGFRDAVTYRLKKVPHFLPHV